MCLILFLLHSRKFLIAYDEHNLVLVLPRNKNINNVIEITYLYWHKAEGYLPPKIARTYPVIILIYNDLILWLLLNNII